MHSFDYDAGAELFTSKSKWSRRGPVGYKRFARAADAIRFAIEDLPGNSLAGAWLKIGDDRFNAADKRNDFSRTREMPTSRGGALSYLASDRDPVVLFPLSCRARTDGGLRTTCQHFGANIDQIAEPARRVSAKNLQGPCPAYQHAAAGLPGVEALVSTSEEGS